MAILNCTPDSFFAASRFVDRNAADEAVGRMVAEGADIIDIGGYSTRPGAAEVTVEEEKRRVLMGVEVVRRVAPAMPVSIDTFRADVAEAVLKRYEGITINDISAAEDDRRMVEVVAKYKAPFIAMHKRGTPQTMQSLTAYTDIVTEVRDYLAARAEALLRSGITDLTLDPGFGFAKSIEQNFELLARLDEIADLGFPILAGISRKSFIYKTLNITPKEALTPTQVLHWECLRRGAAILRTHDTAATRHTIELFEKTTSYETKDDRGQRPA